MLSLVDCHRRTSRWVVRPRAEAYRHLVTINPFIHSSAYGKPARSDWNRTGAGDDSKGEGLLRGTSSVSEIAQTTHQPETRCQPKELLQVGMRSTIVQGEDDRTRYDMDHFPGATQPPFQQVGDRACGFASAALTTFAYATKCNRRYGPRYWGKYLGGTLGGAGHRNRQR